MAPQSSTLAWKIPWIEEPGRLQSMGSPRVGHNWATSLSLFTFMHWRRKWQPTPVFLPEEYQGQRSLVGSHLRGHTVGHDWSNLAAAAAADRQTTEEQRCFRNERREGHSGNQAEDIGKSRGKVAVRSVLKSTPGSVIVTQSCCALRDPMDCSPPGSSVCGIFQARILKRAAIPFSRRSFQPRDRIWVSHMSGRFFTMWATPGKTNC